MQNSTLSLFPLFSNRLRAIGVFLITFLTGITASYAQTISETFDVSGNFTTPACVTSVTVQCWGGGGGGGGSSSGLFNNASGGGGGGAYTTATIPVTPGAIYAVTVGIGGTVGAGAAGGTGGASSFNNQATAQGGAGGGTFTSIGAGNGSGAVGGTGGLYNGGKGANGDHPDYGGGGGGGAGSGGNGVNAGTPNNGVAGTGGIGAQPGGAGGAGTNNSNGQAGAAPGGGGGGSSTNNPLGTSWAGGVGGAGRVIVTYTLNPPTITGITGAGCVGSLVTITGTGLGGATSATIGGTALANINSSATTVTGTIASGTPSGLVTVNTPCGNVTGGPFTINAAPTSTVNASMCQGGSYTINGNTFTSSGTYTVIIAGGASNGCDSTITLNLSISPSITETVNASICAGGSYAFNGNSYTATGTYTATLTGAGTGGCDSIVTLNLTVGSALTSTTNASICTGGSYTFNGTAYTSAGTYTATLAGAGTGGCDSIATLVLTVSSTGTVTVSTSNPTFCPGDSTQICATAGFTTYSWNTGQSGMCIYATLAGNYYLTATDNGSCTATSNHLPISVYVVPSVSISVNGDTLTGYNATSYQWYLNGSPINGATSNVHIASQSGSYTLVITDANGCKATSNAVPISVGINDLANDAQIRIYPNPLTGENWSMEVESALIGNDWQLFDNSGRLIYSSRITNVRTDIALDIAPGLYYIRITSGQSTYVRKLVKM